MILLGLALAAVIGLSLGLLGGGGSILTVPIFVYVLGFEAKRAIAMTLPVVGATSLVAAVGHWRAGNVLVRTALVFGVVAMLGSYLGARASAAVTGSTQLTILALVMLAASVSMFRGRPPAASAHDGTSSGRPLASGWLALVGLGVGALTGFVGIGGGFLIVPALVLLARVPMKQAIGTSLVVIAMNTASGTLGYLDQVSLPWGFMAAFTAVAIGGALAGARLVRRVSQGALRRAFAVFLVLIAGLILYRTRRTLLEDGCCSDVSTMHRLPRRAI